MNRKILMHITAALAVLGFVACGTQGASDPNAALATVPALAAAYPQQNITNGALSIDEYTSGASLRGVYGSEAGAVSFAASENDGGVISVAVTVNGKTLTGTIDHAGQTLTMDGAGAVLSAEEKAGLAAAVESMMSYLEETFQTDPGALELGFASLIGYWSTAPEGYAFDSRVVTADAEVAARGASSNEGIRCIKKGNTVQAVYDDSRGNHYENVRVGSKPRSGYGCMGRCGPDCGRWWIPSSWTKDCMDHDQCSHKNNSSGGSSDSNCGDEFNEAADDWSLGVVRGCFG